VVGAAVVIITKLILLYAMVFAAGAMLFVVEEFIPESRRHGHTDLATGGWMLGFLG
jgi:ZIP family zinc transporter